MFIAQLAAFLLSHHHAHWAHILTTCPHWRFRHILTWATRHGFRYQQINPGGPIRFINPGGPVRLPL